MVAAVIVYDHAVRFQAAMVLERCAELAFDHGGALREQGFHGGFVAVRLVRLDIGRVLMHLRRTGLHGKVGVYHMGQGIVGDADGPDGVLGDLRRPGGDGGHRVALIAQGLAGISDERRRRPPSFPPRRRLSS